MQSFEWIKGFPGSVTVCDTEGAIIYMNDASIEEFRSDGGEKLMGSNVLDCHPEPSRTKLQEMMETCRANIYTIQKHGEKQLVYQTPWYREGQYAGFVEMILKIPVEMPHFNRDK